MSVSGERRHKVIGPIRAWRWFWHLCFGPNREMEQVGWQGPSGHFFSMSVSPPRASAGQWRPIYVVSTSGQSGGPDVASDQGGNRG